MNKKRLCGLLLAGVLALSLLPVAALADAGASDFIRQRITDNWDSYMFLYTDEDGMSGFFLLPSEYDAEHYRPVKAARGTDSTAEFRYDSQGRPAKIVFDSSISTRVETWQYDSQGREIKNTDEMTFHEEDGDSGVWNTVTETVYDSRGRVEKESVTADGTSIVRRFVYDSQDRVIEERIESDSAPGVTVYTYEGANLVKEAFEGDGVRYEVLYTYKDGLLTKRDSVRSDYAGDGRYTETESGTVYFAYDEAGRLVNRKSDAFRSDHSRVYSDEYAWKYFMDGKLRSQEYVWEFPDEDGPQLISRSCTVDYDYAGRVSKVTANGVIHTYSYDQAGNNTEIAVKGEGVDPYTITFTYEKVPAGTPETPAGFTDVPAGAYYEKPVAWAVEKGITAGTSRTTFSPDALCTRGQVVTFLWRAMGKPQASAPSGFTDVEKGSYYEQAVNWAVEKGVASGTSKTTFSPDAPCTRAQVVTFLWRALDGPARGSEGDVFTDVHEGSYYYMPVVWAVDSGVTAGTSNTTFSPDAPCTRAQVVTFLYRALGQAE